MSGDIPGSARLTGVLLPRLLVLGGVLGTLTVVAALPSDVFFSGDGGVKWLLVQQYLAGDFATDLRLPATESVRQIWQQGHYPLGPPFVYPVEGRWVASFPPVFPLLTAPFVAWFGFKGVYVIPLLALYGVWGWCYVLARRMGLGGVAVCLLLAALIFASPLVVYGAIFWEHTLGVLLSLASVAWLLSATRPEGVSRRGSVWLGLVFGLTPWLRPEAYAYSAVFCALSLSAPQLRRQPQTWAFLGASSASVLLLWTGNTLLYGNPLGAHSTQVFQGLDLAAKVQRLGFVLPHLIGHLLAFFPLVWLFLAAPWVWWWTAPSPRRAEGSAATFERLLWAAVVLSVVSVSLVVPNAGGSQHGPRYLLILVPAIALVAAGAFDALWRSPRVGVRRGALAVALLLVLGGGLRNAWAGFDRLLEDSRSRSAPALALLRRSEASAAVVSHQWTAQELAAAMPETVFVRVTTGMVSAHLALQLLDAGHRDVLLISRTSDGPDRSLRYDGAEGGPRIEGRPVGEFGIYRIDRIRLSRR